MVQSASVAFKAALNSRRREPGIEVHIDGCPYVFAFGRTWSAATPGTWRRVVCGDPLNLHVNDDNPSKPAGTKLVCDDSVMDEAAVTTILHNISSISSMKCEVDPTKRVPNFPNMEITLMDAGVLSGLTDPTGAACEVRYSPTGSAAYGDNVILLKGHVKKWEQDEEGLMYHLVVEDLLSRLGKEIFGDTINTELSADMNTTQTTATVVDTTGFPATGTILIKNEIMEYTGKTLHSFTGLRRVFGASVSHLEEDPVIVVRRWPLQNLKRILLEILCSTGTGTNGTYDVLLEKHGCGIPADMIDLDAITTYVPPDGSGNHIQLDFTIAMKKKASEVLESLCGALNAFLIRKNDGTITLLADATPSTSDKTYTYSNSISRMKLTRGDVINRIEWKCIAHAGSGLTDLHTKTTEDTPSVTKHGEQTQEWYLPILPPWTIAGGGKPGQVPPDPPPEEGDVDPRLYDIQIAARYQVNRYKEPYYKYEIKTFWSDLLLEMGDVIQYGTQKARIVGREIDPKTMTITLKAIFPHA